MGRAIFDDIKPPEENVNNDDTASTADHSIRNVAPLETQERETRRAKRAERRRVPEVFEGTSATKQSSARGIIAKYGVWTLAVVVLALALSVVGFVFIGKTTISIVPKQDTVTLSSNIVALLLQCIFHL